MKRFLWCGALTLVCVGLVPSKAAWGQGTPRTWNSYLFQDSYYDSSQPGTSDVISRFTPAKSIRVTRMELQAAGGSQRMSYSPTFQSIPCTNLVAIKITDGRISYTLPLPSAPTLVTGAANSSSADSGKLNLVFPAGATLSLIFVRGDAAGPGGNPSPCTASSINITVQYAFEPPGRAMSGR